ncbi:MAG: polysaccharide deacetylase family protein [Firmicutes bacterium]|nr:polysaccharide deacetylase family protein [Bacillota bacterium]
MVALFAVNMFTSKSFLFSPEPIYQVEGRGPVVFLTFDVLWQKAHLGDILKYLEEQDIEAVFFVTGEWLKKNHEEAQQIIACGHQLGNHTYSHSKLLLMTTEEITNEIVKFNELSCKLLGYHPLFFRPPYGDYNNKIVRIAKEQDLFTLLWSINAKTFSERETGLIISHLEECLHDGAILLCHTFSPTILQVLPEIVNIITWKGYKLEGPSVLKEYAGRKRFRQP